MKYHYQYVSASTVRIELIPEDEREAKLLKDIEQEAVPSNALDTYFAKGLSSYGGNSNLTKINFMKFPKVALCSFERWKVEAES